MRLLIVLCLIDVFFIKKYTGNFKKSWWETVKWLYQSQNYLEVKIIKTFIVIIISIIGITSEYKLIINPNWNIETKVVFTIISFPLIPFTCMPFYLLLENMNLKEELDNRENKDKSTIEFKLALKEYD